MCKCDRIYFINYYICRVRILMGAGKMIKLYDMKKVLLLAAVALMCSVSVGAQSNLKKVYDETANPMQQIDQAVSKAAKSDKNVICQLGGNWCRWCLMFADYITKDTEISQFIDENYVYIHVNYNPRDRADQAKAKQNADLLKRLNNAGRFGYPVLVVLNPEGKVIHIQDSSFLEQDNGYNKDKVMRFLKSWTPSACK